MGGRRMLLSWRRPKYLSYILYMNEGEYLEMVNQLKKKYDENELRVKEVRENYELLVKEVVSVYGVFRLIDKLIDYEQEIDTEIRVLCSALRSQLSELYEEVVTPKTVIKISLTEVESEVGSPLEESSNT